MQWGGRLLCEDGHFPTSDGQAHFAPVEPPELALPDGWFLLSTRRGKQFNSMVHGARDPLVGAARDAVLMCAKDAEQLSLRDGDPVLLRSEVGELAGHCKIVPIRSRNVQVYWPEANALLRRGQCDPVCGIPDYNAPVQVFPVAGG